MPSDDPRELMAAACRGLTTAEATRLLQPFREWLVIQTRHRDRSARHKPAG